MQNIASFDSSRMCCRSSLFEEVCVTILAYSAPTARDDPTRFSTCAQRSKRLDPLRDNGEAPLTIWFPASGQRTTEVPHPNMLLNY